MSQREPIAYPLWVNAARLWAAVRLLDRGYPLAVVVRVACTPPFTIVKPAELRRPS